MFKLLTKKFTKVPLIFISFNLKRYFKYGEKDSCTISIHPTLKNDKYIKHLLNDLVDYIRENYDMESLSK